MHSPILKSTRAAVAVLLGLAACGDDGAASVDAAIGDAVDAAVADGMADAAEVVDPCPATPPACPDESGVVRGGGLRAIDRCAFPLEPDAPAIDRGALIDALPATVRRVTLADIALDLNRSATQIASSALPGTAPGVLRAYGWNAGDQAVPYWIPQGITGSFDGVIGTGTVDDRKLVLVSWYYEQAEDPGSTVDKGVRIAIADVTNPAAVAYRFALLVEPSGTLADPTFRSVPLHAGGLAWVGDRLYVPATTTGFRVFDLSRILALDGLADTIGKDAGGVYNAYSYAYAIPQIGRYTSSGGCAPVFSFVALDRTSTPPSLVSGEYDAAAVTGRLYRWPLASDGTLQRTDRDRVIPDAAYLSAESHVQGALAKDDTWWLSSSRPAAAAGELVRTQVGAPSTTLGWSDAPEDLAFDPQAGSVWSLTEGLDARYFFEVAISAID